MSGKRRRSTDVDGVSVEPCELESPSVSAEGEAPVTTVAPVVSDMERLPVERSVIDTCVSAMEFCWIMLK